MRPARSAGLRGGARLAKHGPGSKGGDRLSHKTEAHSALIHAALAEVPDMTLLEIKARLAGQAPR